MEISLLTARLFDEDALAHHCFEIIDRNCSEAMNTEAFISIDIQTLISVLRRDSLIVDELFLFKRVQFCILFIILKHALF